MRYPERLLKRTLAYRYGFVLVLIFFAEFSASVRAQTATLEFDRLSVADGLPGNSVNDIIRDSRGFVWLATDRGLVRYDGSRFEVFTSRPGDETSLSDNDVYALLEDTEGFIWVGTANGGLNRYNPRTDEFYRFPVSPDDSNGTSHSFINELVQTRDGTIWVATDNGLDVFTGGRFERIEDRRDDSGALKTAIVTDLVEDSDGKIWISSHKGLYVLDRVSGEVASFHPTAGDPASISTDMINTLYLDGSENLWIGTGSGLDVLEKGSDFFKHFASIQGDRQSLSTNRVYAITGTADGAIWIGTVGGDIADGLNRLDPATGVIERIRRNADNPRGLSGNRIVSLFTDGGNQLWVGTLYSGLNVTDIRGPRFARFDSDLNREHPLSGNEILALELSNDGTLWAGTWETGLMQIDLSNGEIKSRISRSSTPGVMGNDILSVYVESDGSLWYGTFDGLHFLRTDNDRVQVYRQTAGATNSLQSNAVSSVFRDNRGILWTGTWNSGLSIQEPGSRNFIHLVPDNENGSDGVSGTGGETVAAFPELRIRDIDEDQRGNVWIRTDTSLYRYDRELNLFDRAPVHGILTFLIDQRDQIWIGTNSDGLVRYDYETRTIRAFDDSDGLNYNSVAGVEEDQDGNIWVMTERGLNRFDIETEKFTSYTPDPPFRINKLGTAESVITPDGTIYFGGGSGILSFHPDRIRELPAAPQVFLTALYIGDELITPGPDALLEQQVSFTGDLRLRHNENDIGFEFSGASFDRESVPIFRVNLENHDNAWTPARPHQIIRYSNLRPGSYRLLIQSSTDGSPWTDMPTGLTINISPPWWATIWAYMLFAVAGAGGIVGLHRLRIRQLAERASNLELEVDERTRQVVAQKEIVEEQSRRLIELDQMKSRFFTNVSHEFRTPLTLILGPLRDALGGFYGAMSRPLSEQLRTMLHNGKRLQNLINQLLDLAKIEAGSIKLNAERVHVARLVRRLVLSFSSLADRGGIKLQMDVAWSGADLPDVYEVDKKYTPDLYVDAEKFGQIVNNLLSNAIKFTPDGGVVTVKLSTEQIRRSNIFCLSVTDTGPGIPESDLERIFDRFYQTSTGPANSVGNSGIGHALAREWATLHHGTVAASIAPGGGLKFDLRIPLGTEHLSIDELLDDSRDEMSTDTEVGASSQSVAGEFDVFNEPAGEMDNDKQVMPPPRPLVIVVEDHDDVREYIASHLARRYEVLEARNGEEALKIAENKKPALIISDVMMPVMDGYALCTAVKNHEVLSDVPVILLTAKAEEESKVEGLSTGADDYIFKPFSANELLVRAENLIDIRLKLRERFSRQVIAVAATDIEVNSADEVFMDRIKDEVEKHLDNSNFGTEWLASDIGISTRQLRRRVKQLTNLSTSGYIRSFRLSRAAQLLEQGAGTVSEIAFAVGFADPRHFSKLYKQIYGMTPSEYAASHKRKSSPKSSDPAVS